ncbi:hypothetical protein F4819DRAFT_491615 [Hypoxylon fuscum]|nr:hypothetical protein F4819DRAFT_491615 [Hypoxylon fuscum]
MAAPSGSSSKGPGHPFILPDPDFDPTMNKAIKEYYEKKEKDGISGSSLGFEDSVEAEAEEAVSNWEKEAGRAATTEERERMMAVKRRILGGSWLEGAKEMLVGKTEVPIALFNRLVAENERTIGFVAQKMASNSDERKKLEAKVKSLQESADKAQSELRACYNQIRERDEKIERLEEELKQSRSRENALKKESRNHDEIVKQLSRELEDANRKSDDKKPDAKKPDAKKPDARKPEDMSTDDMRRIAESDDNLRRFWASVEKTQQTMGDLQQQILNLYRSFGFNEEGITAMDAIDRLTKILADEPKDKLDLKMRIATLIADKMELTVKLMGEREEIMALELQIENAKPTSQIELEVKKELDYFESEAVSRKADHLTQVYRQHRRDILANILNADYDLSKILAVCPHQATSTAIAEVREKYLRITSLPPPRAVPGVQRDARGSRA